jgi:hypothetical protein
MTLFDKDVFPAHLGIFLGFIGLILGAILFAQQGALHTDNRPVVLLLVGGMVLLASTASLEIALRKRDE